MSEAVRAEDKKAEEEEYIVENLEEPIFERVESEIKPGILQVDSLAR